MRILIFYKICLFLIGGVSSQCPSSTQPLLSNNQVLSCQPQEKCVCERMRLGSFCHYSSQHARYICCSSYSNQCMNGAPLLSNTGNVVTCFSNQNCQSGYTCTQQTCCASTMPALCSNSETNCLAGQALINGVCVNQVGLGGLCQDNAQCLGQSQCISGRCQCPTGSIASGGSCVNQPSCQLGTVSINGQCLSFSAPGNQCVASAQCIDSSQCMNSVCTCPSSMRNVNGYCIPYTGGPCLQTQTLVNSQCVTYSIIGGSCIADAQCVGGTYCQNSVCQCKQGTTAMYGYCISDYTVSCNSNQITSHSYASCHSYKPGICFCLKYET
ncbi:unnamed protein product [Auanema sp. JU1783]|nr:unnamed protein product [Auanema sp. JU1783]